MGSLAEALAPHPHVALATSPALTRRPCIAREGAGWKGAPPSFWSTQNGFTLVEIMVVIVILGIVAGMTLALVEPDERDLSAREARRFAGALEYAAQRAQWRNELLGVSADRRLVRYWRRDVANDGWVVVDDDDVLRAHALPDALEAMALAYGGRRIASNAIVPLRASGRNDPFAFVVASARYRTLIFVDPLSRVSIDGPAPAAP